MKQAFAYSFKVWFTALLLTPTMAYFIWEIGNNFLAYINKDRLFSTGLIYGTDTFKISNLGLTLIRSIPYYLPYFVLVFLAAVYSWRQAIQSRFIKIILTSIAIVLTLCAFAIFQVTIMNIVFNEKLAWIVSFGLFYIGGIWFYKQKTE